MWDEADQWKPSWEDVSSLAERILESGPLAYGSARVAPHFLRAIVIEQHGYSLVVGSAAARRRRAVGHLAVAAGERCDAAPRTLPERPWHLADEVLPTVVTAAYAARIGERLRSETPAVATESGHLQLPVLRDHEATISKASEAIVPHTVGRSPGSKR